MSLIYAHFLGQITFRCQNGGRSGEEETVNIEFRNYIMEKRDATHTAAFCIYLKTLPHLQQGLSPKSSASGLPSPLWLCQSHPTTSATVLMTAATASNEPSHTCAAPWSSWQVPSPIYKLYICIHPFLQWVLGPSHSTTIAPDLQLHLCTLFRWDSQCSTHCLSAPKNSSFIASCLINNYGTHKLQDTSIFFTEILPHQLTLSGGQLH